MEHFTQSLTEQVKRDIDSLRYTHSCPISHAEACVNRLAEALDQLKSKCLTTRFATPEQEVTFFKKNKPQLTALLLYHMEQYRLFATAPVGRQAKRKFLKNELENIRIYRESQKAFYEYYRSGSTYLDHVYFIRGQNHALVTLDHCHFISDHRFSTSHDHLAARIIANDMVESYLENCLYCEDAPVPNVTPLVRWTGPKVALIELVYALHAEGVFGNGNAALKEVAMAFETAFGVELGQYHRVFLELRARKSERARFLDNLRKKLIVRMDEADGI